ncbi:MAG: magnesium transporter CorA family protein [Candidatus Caenarcaniphilales bacterium]|nr:magnesium transporter CorA family protein [Candidatus Caenarcaniphilales bacterium]
MIRIFQSVEGRVKQLETETDFSQLEKGSWLHVVAPTNEELDLLASKLEVEREILHYPLDEDERSRIEQEENYTLFIINFPITVPGSYDTCPFGILLTESFIVTICVQEPVFLAEFTNNKIRTFDTRKKMRFVLQILYRISILFMLYLRQISRRIDHIEETLKTATKNPELIKLLGLGKSLVYFSTALRANQNVLEKIQKVKYFRIYEEDHELLEDTITENRQSMEMATIYSNILASTSDAYASVISNNLNAVMKFMTTATIVIMLPTTIFNLYGMNLDLPFQRSPFGFLIVCGAAFLVTIVSVIFFIRQKFF